MNRQQRIARHLKKTFTIREAKTTEFKRNVEETDNGGEDKKKTTTTQLIHTHKPYNREDKLHP